MPENPRTSPEQALDALEERVLGHTVETERTEDDTDEPAFEQDIEPDEVSGEHGGHKAQEPPA